VKQAVVVAPEAGSIDRGLVAYVVPKARGNPSIPELRQHLRNKLPDYMAPAVFMILDALPLTPTGKVDRRALPAPDQSRPDLAEACVGPRNPAEERLVGIWAEALGLEKVGVYDNFFDLGGHSLLAVRVVNRMRDAFEIELPIRRIFEMPTIAQLAEAIDEAKQPGARHPPPRIRPLPRNAYRSGETEE
jgi:acyl carrier protein